MLDARGLRQGPDGHVIVSTLFVGNKVYAIPESGKREAKVIIDKTEQATGIDFHKGSLYFATHKRIVRYDNGRLVAEDPASGASIELYAFGNDNKAAVERLLDQQ